MTTSQQQPVLPPPPPPNYYGAIAVAHDGAYGRSWNYYNEAAADEKALNECAGSCAILVNFVNGCGAIAYNRATNMYWGSTGRTSTEAIDNAISRAGGGRWITWVCTK
jgi:hypothetical protein